MDLMQNSSKRFWLSLLDFDWKSISMILGVLGMAGMWYLGHFFLTIDQSNIDKTHFQEMMNLRFEQILRSIEEIKRNQEETKKDVKEIAHEQRRSNQ